MLRLLLEIFWGPLLVTVYSTPSTSIVTGTSTVIPALEAKVPAFKRILVEPDIAFISVLVSFKLTLSNETTCLDLLVKSSPVLNSFAALCLIGFKSSISSTDSKSL